MSRLTELPNDIALFPLSGALLLPRANLPLHIFEPRYLSMVDDALKTQMRLIGMVQPLATAHGESQLYSIGCAGRITSFTETHDGRYMLTLSGISRFRIIEQIADQNPYRTAHVHWRPFIKDNTPQEEDDPQLNRDAFLGVLHRYFVAKNIAIDITALQQAPTEQLINAVSILAPFTAEDKQALLEAPSLTTRRETLTALIEFSLHGDSDNNPKH